MNSENHQAVAESLSRVGKEDDRKDINSDVHHCDNIDRDINLIDLFIALGREKWVMFVVTLVSALAGVFVSLTATPIYEARSTIMPSQQGAGLGGGAGLSGLGSLGALAGLSGAFGGVRSSDEIFIALMRSQSVQSSLIEKLDLKQRYGSKNLDGARLALNQSVVIGADKKSGLVVVTAKDKDPTFAARLANAQIEELGIILGRLSLTEAQQRRAFFEHQIAKMHIKMPQLELEYKNAQAKSGVEVASLLSEAASLPAQIASKELQVQLLGKFATSQNPEIKRLIAEISALRAQLSKYQLSQADGEKQLPNPSRLGADSSKALYQLKATQAFSVLKIQEALLEGYVRQLELAKLDEAKEGSAVQVVDVATPPEMRAKPERKKMVLAFTVTGFFIGLMLAALMALIRQMKSTPHGTARFIELKRAWGLA